MSSQTAMTLLNAVEFALWATFGLLFWSKKLHLRFPAMSVYLALHLVSAPVLLVLFQGQAQHWFNNYCFLVYFLVYWAVYIASAVILYFVCLEVFRSALAAFPGLIKFGSVVFQWAVLASVIVSFSTISLSGRSLMIVPEMAFGLMRSVSILELCLLAFLCLSMKALSLSPRDKAFGLALGFGLMSTNDFLQSSLISRHTRLTDPIQFLYESLILAVVGVWATYAALPEPVRKPVVVPASSTVYRWNEIALALGHSGPKVALQEQASGFFLTDVERVVERVLARNLKKSESES